VTLKSKLKKRIIIGIVLFIFFLSILLGINNIGSDEKYMTKNSDNENAMATEKLKSLPYLGFVVNDSKPGENGVTLHNKVLSYEGINIYNSYKMPGAYLIDMEGNTLHSWKPKNSHKHWHFVRMLKNGDLLVVIKDIMLMKINWHSKIKWMNKKRFHHEVTISENGEIYTLSRKKDWINYKGNSLPILNDYLTILSPDGEIEKSMSFYKMLGDKIPAERLNRISLEVENNEQLQKDGEKPFYLENDTIFDLFHINYLEIINKNSDEIWKKGNILFCSKKLNLIGIIDPIQEKLLWSFGEEELLSPHHPASLENGNILIFDNGERRNRGYSRIIELNPYTKKILWEYKGSLPFPFFASWGGANQKLPNGNILITYSPLGYVFEITKEGEVVWEFYNPDRGKPGKRATIYRMLRILDPELHNFINSMKNTIHSVEQNPKVTMQSPNRRN
tara:strand:+ start:6852 stop:8192 length:1341 start_codon:yes stop_codon:yes gene_type:complete